MQLNCIFLIALLLVFFFFVPNILSIFDQFVACHGHKWQSGWGGEAESPKVKSLPNARWFWLQPTMNGDNERGPESVICKLPNIISGVLKCRKTHWHSVLAEIAISNRLSMIAPDLFPRWLACLAHSTQHNWTELHSRAQLAGTSNTYWRFAVPGSWPGHPCPSLFFCTPEWETLLVTRRFTKRIPSIPQWAKIKDHRGTRNRSCPRTKSQLPGASVACNWVRAKI